MNRSKLFDLLRFILGWPISLISLYFVLKILSPKASYASFINQANPIPLILAFLLFFFYSVFRVLTWKEILKAKKHDLTFKKTYFFWLSSEFKRYAPGNIWSFLGKIISFESLGVKKKEIGHSLILESELVILGSLLVSVLSLPFIFRILPDTRFELITQPVIGGVVFLLCLLFVFSKKFLFPKFKYLTNLRLLAYSFVSFLFFSLGSYFATVSFFYINPRDFLLISGYFSFALLVGYLSVITPMGLGVREAVIIFGLSQILTIEQAAFAALFSRVLFIVTELSSLLFAFLWKRIKKFPLEEYASKNLHFLILLLFIIFYTAYFTNTAFLRHDNFYTGRFDLGNMDQTVWNTVRGRTFQLTDPNGTNITSRLSFHADFILILLAPFYFLWRDPKTLLVIQSIILPLGSIFIYLLGVKILRNKTVSLVLAFSFLINPAVNYSNLYDFHPVVLATTFLLGSFYFLILKKYFLFVIFIFLSGITKENVWVITALMGLYAIFFEKKIKLGLWVFTLSLAVFSYLVLFAMPAISGGKNFALSYYSDFGDSPLLILKNALTSPLKTISVLLRLERLSYLKDLFLPLAFLPFFSPFVILAIPSLLINMLSNNSLLYQINYQYTATVTPFLFIAAIYALRWIKKKTPSLSFSFYACIILLYSLYAAYDFGPLPGARIPNIEMYTNPLTNRKTVETYIDRIPKRYSVAATNNLGAHLSHRQRIYTVPIGIGKADLILFLLRGSDLNSNIKAEKEAYAKVVLDPNYQKIFENGQFVVFKKRPLI